MIVYKKVRDITVNGKSYLASAFIDILGLKLCYSLGERTVPIEPTRLFAFNSVWNANEWIPPGSWSFKVLECETSDDNVTGTFYVPYGATTLQGCINGWKQVDYGRSIDNFPRGTLVVPWLKPLRVV